MSAGSSSATPAGVSRTKSKWREAYDEATAHVRILDGVRCKACSGFGWINRYGGHFTQRNRHEDEVCHKCEGEGYRKGIKLVELLGAVSHD